MNELNIGEIIIEEEIDIGNLELDIIKELPEYESLEITPTAEEQIKEGSFNKVTVAGDENLIPENISKGTIIFGVEGTATTTSLKIKNASHLFRGGSRLDCYDEIIPLCEDVTSMSDIFNSAGLKELDLSNFFDTSKVTSMNYAFSGNSNLTKFNLGVLNTNSLKNADYMFNGCRGIVDLDLSNLDFSTVTNVYNIFSSCQNLTNLKIFKNLGKAYDVKRENYMYHRFNLSDSTKLTHESLMDVINNLYDLNLTYDVANGGTLYRQQLVLGATNLAKLTAEEIAIATNKGWNVS